MSTDSRKPKKPFLVKVFTSPASDLDSSSPIVDRYCRQMDALQKKLMGKKFRMTIEIIK